MFFFPSNIVIFENVLLTMGKGLRTNLKTRTKAKYRGKEKLYDVMRKKEEHTSQTHHGLVRVKNLVELDLNGCLQVKDVNIETLTEVFKYLEIFRIGYITSITDMSMKAIATHLKQLRVLDIRYCQIQCKCSLSLTFIYWFLSVTVKRSQMQDFSPWPNIVCY